MNQRRRKKHRLLLLIMFSLFLLTSGSSADWRVSDAHSVQGTLTVTFIDVGQGDATLVTQGKHALLIDGGDIGQGPLIIRTLKQLRIDHLDAIIATHPHADHIGGLAAVMEEFPVDQIIMPRVSHTTALYEELLLTIRKHQLRIIAARPGLRYQLGQARLEILGPEETDPDDLNNSCVISRITFGRTAFLSAGDAGFPAEESVMERQAEIRADLLKVAHHGSATSTSDEWLDRVRPETAVISVAAGNRYGHPVATVIDRLNQRGIDVWRTDLQGTIQAVSDGEQFRLSAEYPDGRPAALRFHLLVEQRHMNVVAPLSVDLEVAAGQSFLLESQFFNNTQ